MRNAAATSRAVVTRGCSCNSKGGSIRGWALSLPRRILRTRTRFSKFFASTLDPNRADPLVRATDLFPCPPLPEVRSAARKNGHARARWSLRIAARRWTNVGLACFSWEACGRPALAPATARCGVPLSDSQAAVAARLESRVKSLLRAGHAAPGRGAILSLEEGIEEYGSGSTLQESMRPGVVAARSHRESLQRSGRPTTLDAAWFGWMQTLSICPSKARRSTRPHG